MSPVVDLTGAQTLTRSTKWEVLSINLPFNTFAFKTYLKVREA